MSFLHLVETCDNFDVQSNLETLASLSLSEDVSNSVVGLLKPEIVALLRTDDAERHARGANPRWRIISEPGRRTCVSFARWLDTPTKRSRAMEELCEGWRDAGLFADVIGGRLWRDELYPVYRDPFGAHDAANLAFCVERSACALFGVVTYGVHMSIYHPPAAGTDVRMWVPTRARTKQTWAGYLDNTVAGGIPAGMSAFESLVKEAMEEASIGVDVVRKHAKCVGAISYFFRTSKGWLQPEVEYVYDLAVPPDADPSAFEPKPLDGEVEAFELLSLQDVISRMQAGLFKPNCALVILDFLIRKGFVTPENEPSYLEITTRLHGRFDYDKWGRT